MLPSLLWVFAALALPGICNAAPASASDESHALSKRALPRYVQYTASAEDQQDLAKLQAGWTDSLALAAAAERLLAPENVAGHPIIERYFPLAGKADIRRAFHEVLGDDGTGGAMFNNVIINNWRNPEHPNSCTTSLRPASVGMNTLQNVRGQANTAYIFPCKKGLTFESLDAIRAATCGKQEIDYQMLTVGAELLHEYMHINSVGFPAIGNHITDFPDAAFTGAPAQPPDPVSGYGPLNTRRLRQARGANEIPVAPMAPNPHRSQVLLNADNYAWLAIDAYFTEACGHGFLAASENCPAPGEGGCGSGDCCTIL